MFVKRIFVATAVIAACALVAVNERSARSPLALLGDDKPLGYVKLQVPEESTLHPRFPDFPRKGKVFSYGGIGSATWP